VDLEISQAATGGSGATPHVVREETGNTGKYCKATKL